MASLTCSELTGGLTRALGSLALKVEKVRLQKEVESGSLLK